MPQEIAPIAVRPSTLSGISEQMVVSHYENNYGNAVRTLNAVRREIAALDAGTPPYRLRGLKREELSLMGSVALQSVVAAGALTSSSRTLGVSGWCDHGGHAGLDGMKTAWDQNRRDQSCPTYIWRVRS